MGNNSNTELVEQEDSETEVESPETEIEDSGIEDLAKKRDNIHINSQKVESVITGNVFLDYFR